MSVLEANADRVSALRDDLSGYPGLLIAFSAGVDSGFLLAAALRALPAGRVLAVTAVSPSLPAAELAHARDFAALVGARHREARTDEMQREGYRQNGTSRCYFCKSELLDVVTEYLGDLPAGSRVATGTNADDLVAGFRPGIRAAAERGAVTPLADAGLDKATIRATARLWGLPVWDKPQAACLSSRVAYGIEISPTRLARVEAAEIAVRSSLQASRVESVNIRVRDLGDSARIEVDRDLVERPGPWQDAVVAAVRSTGFRDAQIDPRGFRSGSMNEGRTPPG
jgi:pyridinium-3,5-biscarboxylic acid mononucleotide sulfurtransferase